MPDPIPTSQALRPSADSGLQRQVRDIPGWGADLDEADRPAHPKERHPPRLPGHAQRTPSQQSQEVEVLHSLERPALTPVFGSSLPPRGLSGRLRRYAFGFSESDLRHWLVLLLADRVDMLEGLGEDLARGHVPNLLREMGWRAEWRYNRAAFIRRVATAVLLAGAAVWVARMFRPGHPLLPPPRH